MAQKDSKNKLLKAFRNAGRVVRTKQAIEAGIHPETLYALRDAGTLEPLSRGLYRIADEPPLSEPDLVTVAGRIPKAVICLVSALHFHRLSTEIPHEVSIALPQGAKQPKLDWPPLRVFRFSPVPFQAGIETHERDGVMIRVYSAAKTVADCFKFRNRIGVELAVEALRDGLTEKRFTPAEFMRFAEICRVGRIVRPYLDAIL